MKDEEFMADFFRDVLEKEIKGFFFIFEPL